LWRKLVHEAKGRRDAGAANLPAIAGFDVSAETVAIARDNVRRAGLEGRIHLEQLALEDQPRSPQWGGYGLLITNPPYGHRLEANAPVETLYMALGDWARTACPGWHAAVFTTRSECLAALGLRSRRVYRFFNGAMACRLGVYELNAEPTPSATPPAEDAPPPPALVNRIRKNLKHLKRWAQRQDITCFRVYDADIPEYAFAVDVYRDADTGTLRAHVQEYAPPAKIAPRKAQRRREEAVRGVCSALGVQRPHVAFKVRRRRRAGEQYGRQAEAGHFHVVREQGCRLRVNLTDYLDTGLFLDHRPLRRRIQDEASGKRFLNLFGYTGSATVHAAVGGATATTTVDLSRTYLDWAQENLRLNGLRDARHRLVRSDCREWLREAAGRGERFDIILLDPPTVSTSRRTGRGLDVQRDHPELIRLAASLLAPGGVMYFSTNNRRFQLDQESLTGLNCREITPSTIPRDFERNRGIHRCWEIKST
jgi:23S rRNA (guanine2445-N2)-methyltransferase / 23S rRNA (guanine2069-N7)-methyltransferase